MARADLAVLCALGAALFIAIGDVIHERQAHEVSPEPVGHLELFARLLRDRAWWIGSLVAAVGFTLQAAALGLGSVLLVQALLAAAIAVIVTVGNPTPGHARGGAEMWTVVALVLVPALVLCLVGARIWSGTVSAVLLGLGSGAQWGVFAVLTKGVVDRLGDGLWELLAAPELYVWAALAVGGTVLQQASFRAGSLTASLPTMTVAEPVVASVLGVVVLGETLRPGDAGWATLVAAMAVMVVSTAALARSEAATAGGTVAAH